MSRYLLMMAAIISVPPVLPFAEKATPIPVSYTHLKALSTFLRREIEVIGAGRTDAGVHASLMVAHFAVSYTHLDVYKRQVVGSPFFLIDS